MVGEKGKIDVLKANPFVFSGIENRYRSLGEEMGQGWQIGKRYKAKQPFSAPEAGETIMQCEIIERLAQPVLSIRSQVPLVAVVPTIGESAMAIYQYAGEMGCAPTGPLFVAYHEFDGQAFDLEIGFPFAPGMMSRDNIKASEIPGGKLAVYHHVGPYGKLPAIRVALEQWLNGNSYIISGTIYELYLNDPQTTAAENLEIEIMFPLLLGD